MPIDVTRAGALAVVLALTACQGDLNGGGAGACQGVRCESPPPPSCDSAAAVKSYAAAGSCAMASGQCDYAVLGTSCPHGTGLPGIDVNECPTGTGACSPNAPCANAPGARTGPCKGGSAGDGVPCADVNECLPAKGGCGATAPCPNAVGSRPCTCRSGF